MNETMFKRAMIVLISIFACAVLAAAVAAGILLRSPAFGRLPRGERQARIERSPNFRDGEFRNRQPTELMTSQQGRFRGMLRFLMGRKPRRLRPDAPMPAVRSDLRSLDPSQELLVWFGHSSYLLQTAGKRILVDPVFCRAAPVGFVNRPFAGTDIYSPDDMPDVDYLIITHDHWDHLDYHTVVRLKERIGRVICPLGVGEHFACWGFEPERIVELDWDETVRPHDGFSITALPARHFSGRGLRANRTLWASFLVESPVQRIYIGGDGGYGGHFADIGSRFPGIGLAILENGQYNEAWRHIHTLPSQLDRTAADLGARRVLTVHHSKYALARHAWDEPLQNVRRLAESDSLQVLAPAIGEIVPIAPLRTENIQSESYANDKRETLFAGV